MPRVEDLPPAAAPLEEDGAGDAVRVEVARGAAGSLVLLIGDGMGVAHVAAASVRRHGRDGRLRMERMPVTGLVRTEAADALVLAAPVNNLDVNALTRAFIERMVGYMHWPFGAEAPVAFYDGDPAEGSEPRERLTALVGETSEVAKPITVSPVNTAPPQAKHRWFEKCPGVCSVSSIQPSPATISPSDRRVSGAKYRSTPSPPPARPSSDNRFMVSDRPSSALPKARTGAPVRPLNSAASGL